MEKNHKNGNGEITLDKLTGKIDFLGSTVDKLAGKVDSLGNTVDKLAILTVNGFDNVKSEFKREFKEFKLEVNQRFNRVENRLDAIEDNTHDLVNTDEKTGREIDKLKQRVSILESKAIHKTA